MVGDGAVTLNQSWFNLWIKAENFFWKERVEKALAEWPKS